MSADAGSSRSKMNIAPTSKMRQKFAFTLIETLVVMVIVAILAAILLPVLSAVRTKAKITSCEANLYQLGRGNEMPDDAHTDVSHCPYPQGDDDGSYIDVSAMYKSNDPNYAPDGGTVRTYCVEHLAKGTDTRFEVPLRGKFTVLKFAGGTSVIDAKAVARWKKIGSAWKQIPETGEIPVYPEIWHFTNDDFPK
jgi:prepilin-type N-terminal cleavage/methylation domain-containing protein